MTQRLPELVDYQVYVDTRDGKLYIGTLRSIDENVNIILEAVIQRLIVKNKFADIPVGSLFLRGDSICTISYVSSQTDITKKMERVELGDLIEDYTAERTREKQNEIRLAEHLAEKGLIYEGQIDPQWSI
ncbi:hypothetical protein BLNAU_12706 [Blattamonas nauphoetae]|uniref:Sm domain-containing protein n=1 Tax=Blattamonas nauphoetae TaxID=2049346 RepID=A0ABQ9XIP5_9EUKA|nr:hypothetical protein BLNAU_12706 [Blattamonas nauphoetae]